jgi:glycosyltransferase involved in cell wall biosynthesis
MRGKVLHLIGKLARGGSERQLLYVVQALHKRAWPQSVVTFDPGQAWDSQLSDLGVPLLAVPRSRNKLKRLWQLSRIIRDEGPALIHSWSDHTNVYARWVRPWAPPRVIMSLRNNPLWDVFLGVRRRRLEHAAIYRRADCVISNSRSALEDARAAGARIRWGVVVSNIVRVPGRAMPGSQIDRPRVVAAGTLNPRKAYEVLLAALAQVAASGAPFQLQLAGDGPERPALEALATRLGIRESVEFLGYIPDVPALFAGGHLLVHPSRMEGLSNTVLEALAEGLPVVATAVGAVPEFVADGQTGFLVPPGEPGVLAARIRSLLGDPTLRERLGKNGLTRVRQVCGEDRVVSQYEHVYQALLAGGPLSPTGKDEGSGESGGVC